MPDDLTATLTDESRGTQFHYPRNVTSESESLILRSFEGEDRMGRLFKYRLDLLCETMDIDFDRIVGENVAVSIETNGTEKRYFNGYVTDFAFRGSEGRFGRFSATLRPWFWFLSQTSNCRIFQNKSVPAIIEKIFEDNGVKDFFRKSLTRTYPEREYCVQYRESDLDFVSRLMETEGIYYFFEHERSKHTMVLADSISAHDSKSGYEKVPYYPSSDDGRHEEHLEEWILRQSIVPTDFTQKAYDFKKPRTDLTCKSKLTKPQNHKFLIGQAEVFEYPGDFESLDVGRKNAVVLSETWETQGLRLFSSGVARGMAAGCTFALTGFPQEKQNREYLIVSVHHQINGDDPVSGTAGDEEPYRCRIEAITKAWPYRSQRTTPKPIIRGPQTAMVVGQEGEEIYCDKYGRVKVRFHWDRSKESGEGGVKDQDKTCWIRVSQIWAGKNWGGIHTPRIGQEVVVSFLEGNPDQPLITGAVYNADNMPPYAMPDNMTQSGIKSRSTKKGLDDDFNELRFEDLKGKEEVHFQAEKDLNSVVKNKESRKVGASRTTEIGEGEHDPEDKPTSKNDVVETVTLYGSRKTEIEGNDVYDVATKPEANIGRKVTVKNGDENLLVSLGDITREATAGKVLESALQSIEFKVGSATSIKLTPDGITVKAANINIEGVAMAALKSPMTTVEGTGIATIKGGLVKIN